MKNLMKLPTEDEHYEETKHGFYTEPKAAYGLVYNERGGMWSAMSCEVCGTDVRTYHPPQKECPTCGGSGSIDDES